MSQTSRFSHAEDGDVYRFGDIARKRNASYSNLARLLTYFTAAELARMCGDLTRAPDLNSFGVLVLVAARCELRARGRSA